MKLNHRGDLVLGAGVAFVAMLLTVGVPALGADETVKTSPAAGDEIAAAGVVTFRSGRAFRSPVKGKKKSLKKGSKVFPGDVVKTVARSKLEIKLADGSVLRLAPKSEATLKRAAFVDGGRRVSVGLKLGKAWTKVTKAFGTDSNYEISTDNAVAGVRGTTFRVNANKDHSTLVRVYNGAVAVAGIRPMYQKQDAGPGREEVAGPKQVDKGTWEKLVGQMMSIKIAANGQPAEPEAFAAEDEKNSAEKSWIAWNEKRDAAGAVE